MGEASMKGSLIKRIVAPPAWVILAGIVCLSAGAAVAAPPQPATDGEIAEMVAAADGDYGAAAIAYVLDEADVYVQDSGLANTESCQVIKILTDAGTRSQSVLRHEFDPATNRVTIKSVRIHRKGGLIEDVAVDSLITQPAKQSMIYWGNRQHVLGIPRLEIGDCLEIRISKIGYNIAYLNGPGDGGGGGNEDLQPPMPGH